MTNDKESKRIVRVGSRASRLAVIQSEIVMRQIEEACPDVSTELVTMKTTGDKILDRTLDQIGGKGLFVKELDEVSQVEEVDDKSNFGSLKYNHDVEFAEPPAQRHHIKDPNYQ